MSLDFDQLRNLINGRASREGIVDAACPLCGPKARAPGNRTRKVMRIWSEDGFITYNCARCGENGWARDDRVQRNVVPVKPASPPPPDKTDLARFLWSRSTEIKGTVAEQYLRTRCCFVDSPSLRYLPPRGEHASAMIARFGGDLVTGVHLTRLKPDGSGKADIEGGSAKIMIGPSLGKPIIVADNPDRGEIIIAEGIEDAATLHLATGWTAWAAGSLSRLAPVAGAASAYERIYLALDEDTNFRAAQAGRRALAEALNVRKDIIPVRFGYGCDANKTLLKFGVEAVLATIEWSEAKSRYSRREITFGEFERTVGHAHGCFLRALGDAPAAGRRPQA